MIFRRSRFHDVVRRQLDLFESEQAAVLEEARAADEAWTRADTAETEERYGDYQLVVDAIGEKLHDIRETYAASLAERAAVAYRSEFDRAALKRFGRYATFLREEDD